MLSCGAGSGLCPENLFAAAAALFLLSPALVLGTYLIGKAIIIKKTKAPSRIIWLSGL